MSMFAKAATDGTPKFPAITAGGTYALLAPQTSWSMGPRSHSPRMRSCRLRAVAPRDRTRAVRGRGGQTTTISHVHRWWAAGPQAGTPDPTTFLFSLCCDAASTGGGHGTPAGDGGRRRGWSAPLAVAAV